ncbi:MAG: hypothetical protein GY822_08385 [Deltaproteobacteria bacterium]|nr:hypothetical protein [Deltaproteobacteria bacterium]
MGSSSTRNGNRFAKVSLAFFLCVPLCSVCSCADDTSSSAPQAPPLKLSTKGDAGIVLAPTTTTTKEIPTQKSTPQTPTLTAWMSPPVVTDGGAAEKSSIGPASPKMTAGPSTSTSWQLPSSPKALVWTHPLPVVAAKHFSLALESRAGTPWPAEVEYTQRSTGLLEARLEVLEPLPSGDQLSLIAKSGAGSWRVPLVILQGSTERPPWKRTPPKRRRRRSRRRR